MLKNELVEVRKDEIFTTSPLIAEKLWASHFRVLKVINKILDKRIEIYWDLGVQKWTPKSSQKFIETEFEHWKTKIKYKWYLINESAFIKIVMNLWSFKKAFIVQDEITRAFIQMKETLQNQSNNSWIEARNNWKILRKEETDVIKQLTEYAEKERGKPLTFPLYSTYTKMTNKHLQFIVDCKDWKPIRDLVWIRDLWFIWIVDDRCKNTMIDWMNRWLPYKEVYYYCKDEVSKLVESLDFKPKTPIS